MIQTERPAANTEDLAALEDAVSDLINGVRDRKKIDEAAKELEEGREEIRCRLGLVDISAELTDRDE
jgi:hypothetical protein